MSERMVPVPVLLSKVWVLLLFGALQASAASTTGWIGTYTSSNRQATGSLGIYGFRWDSKRREISDVRAIGSTSNPSFLAIHPNGRFLYAVNEDSNSTGDDTITAFAIEAHEAGEGLQSLGSVSSQGSAPCHVSVDPAGKWLFAANYLSGTIAVFAIQTDGRLAPALHTLQQHGAGPIAARQGSAHAHEVVLSPDGRFLLSTDLGADRVFIYKFAAATGELTPNLPSEAVLPAGSGPRHLVFSRDSRWVYTVAELTGALVTLRWNAVTGTLAWVASTSTLPPQFHGARSSAEIALEPSGRFLYVSNRGDSNSIGIFRIRKNGRPVTAGWVSSGGRVPRFITIDPSGRYLFVVNQDSGNLVTFRIASRSGALTRVGRTINVPSAVAIAFAPPRQGGHD